ncbi:hypothetical protein PABG_04610 [Paracoccidioides brasiliensis Pb03]|nr:hypothetical protein PABG_04610 [Paracoccidioides brasiliensis Pb03]
MGAGRKLETGGSPVKQTVGQQNHPQQCAEQLLFCSLLLCSRVPGKEKKEEEEEEEESYQVLVPGIRSWQGRPQSQVGTLGPYPVHNIGTRIHFVYRNSTSTITQRSNPRKLNVQFKRDIPTKLPDDSE